MLSSILKRSKSITQQSPTSHLNPEKPTIKTSDSEHQKEQFSLQQYTQLEALLQSRQASLRQHAKHEYQLKLFIQDLQQKNIALSKNNANILAHYKTQVTTVKKQNQTLRKSIHKLQTQNNELKRQLQQALAHIVADKPQSNTPMPEPLHQRAKSQSVIKVIDSVDQKQSFRESQPNFRLSPFNMSGKQTPIVPSQDSRRNLQSQSRQKLQVTIKPSKMLENANNATYRRNQKHILSQNNHQDDSVGRQRSIKRLNDLKRMNECGEDEIMLKKIATEKASFSVCKKASLRLKNEINDQNQVSQDLSSHIAGEITQQRNIIRNQSKQMGEEIRRSIHSGTSRQLASGEERRSRQMKRSKPSDSLIKLGHYGSGSLPAEKTDTYTSRNFNSDKAKESQ